MVLVEAMIFAKPIVATDIEGSGVSWVNEGGVTGVNVEPKNPIALAEGILTIFEGNYELYSENARKRFEQHFSDDEMLLVLRNYYLQLADIATAPVIKELSRRAI